MKMSSENWMDIEDVPILLQSSSWEEKIGGLSKLQLLLIAEYLNLEVVEGTKKGELLLEIVDAVKASKERKGSELLDESLLLTSSFSCKRKR